MKNGRQMTFGMIVGNRGFFPGHLAKEGREEMLKALDGAGIRNLADRLATRTPAERGLIDTDVMIVVSKIVMHERFVQCGVS